MAEEQDDLAAEWGLALAEQGVPPKGGAAGGLTAPAKRAATTWPPNGRR